MPPLRESQMAQDGDALSNQSLDAKYQSARYSRAASPNSEGADGCVDEETESQPLSFRRAMILIAMAFLWTASQIPLYFVSSVTPVKQDMIADNSDSTEASSPRLSRILADKTRMFG